MLFFIVTAALAGILSVESTQSTDCEQPPTIPHAKLLTTSTTHGSYAFYSFQGPYKLIGHQRAQCLNGEWINKPICNISDGNTLTQHKNMHSSGNLGCSDLLRMGYTRSGIYTISTRINLTEKKSLDVYCDMETDGGGWTVIQRRGDFQNPVDYFDKDWKSYKEGFGYLEKEFWLGNDNIYALTNQAIYSARFDLGDVEGKTAYAHYDVFWIDDEDSKYTLHLSNYSGNAGGDSMSNNVGQKFSTKDQDNDQDSRGSCAKKYKGAWWFSNASCWYAYLNGEYIKGKTSNYIGNHWYNWKGNYDESLAKTEIKIRPKNHRV